MKRTMGTITASLAVCGLLASGLVAQDKGLQGGLMRASKVNGMDVRNAENKNLGDIQDVVLDQESGRIAYAVLSFGGFLGIGDKLFAVPWAALKPAADKKAFTLDIPKERLEKAPGFDKKNWPDLANRQWGADIHSYYGVPPYWEVRGGVVAPEGGNAPHGMLMRTSKIIGMDVHNPANQNLGDVQDLVLDQEPAVVAYSVLSFGGFLGIGDKLFALPWQALKLDADHKKFTLDIPKERLEKAPGFDKKDWPDLNNRQWGIDIHTYYGIKPYWEVQGGGIVAKSPEPAARQEVKVYTGKVKTFTRKDPAVVVIKTDAADLDVELAPMAFLEQNRLAFAEDDAVTVKAYEIMRDGKKVFVVTEVTTKDNRTVKLRRDDLSPLWGPEKSPGGP
jgi:sporulation protein YlmC with PRC-barrel domain